MYMTTLNYGVKDIGLELAELGTSPGSGYKKKKKKRLCVMLAIRLTLLTLGFCTLKVRNLEDISKIPFTF